MSCGGGAIGAGEVRAVGCGEEVDFAEEGAERCAGGGGDAEAGLADGPDGDVEGGVEEVFLVGEGCEVGDADYGCC